MSVERARKFLSQFGMEDKIITFKESSATVELAAKAAGTEPALPKWKNRSVTRPAASAPSA